MRKGRKTASTLDDYPIQSPQLSNKVQISIEPTPSLHRRTEPLSFQHRHAPSTPTTHLFLDWDGTLTPQSTLPLIARINTFAPPLANFTVAWQSDFAAHLAPYTPPAALRREIHEELQWLESLEVVERASTERIERDGLFRGVIYSDERTGEDGDEGGSEKDDMLHTSLNREVGSLELRRGAYALIQETREHGGAVDVVSVSWSGAWIRGMLRRKLPACVIPKVAANEIERSGSGKLSRTTGVYAGEYVSQYGGKARGLWTAGDKTEVMQQIVRSRWDSESFRLVYVGDSLTDLGCLLEADVGVCIRDNTMDSEQSALAETLERLRRVDCKWIGQFDQEMPRDDPVKILWWARDFDEIRNALFK